MHSRFCQKPDLTEINAAASASDLAGTLAKPEQQVRIW
jgi:hypothetical protein